MIPSHCQKFSLIACSRALVISETSYAACPIGRKESAGSSKFGDSNFDSFFIDRIAR